MYLVVALFLVAHVLTTVGVGLWLNRRARTEVASAAETLAPVLRDELRKLVDEYFPGLGDDDEEEGGGRPVRAIR